MQQQQQKQKHLYIDCSKGCNVVQLCVVVRRLAVIARYANEASEAALSRLLMTLDGLDLSSFLQALEEGASDPLFLLPAPWAFKCSKAIRSLHPESIVATPVVGTSVELNKTVVEFVWWIYCMNGTDENGGIEVSCTPLSCSPARIALRPDLFTNVPVQITNEGFHVFDDASVALLNCLFTPRSCNRTPPMTLDHVVSDDSGTVTLIMGQVAVGKDSTTLAAPSSLSKESAEGSVLEGRRSDLWRVDRDLALLETNIDDMTAEHLAFCAELLIQLDSVVDCWLIPIVMKKGRAAHTLHCLCRNSAAETALECIFTHCTTLGVRVHSHRDGFYRVALRRSVIGVEVDLPDGTTATVDCKVARLGTRVVSIKAEYDQCRALVLSHCYPNEGTTIQDISRQAVRKAMQLVEEIVHKS
jgi:Protein of unknown function DUF111